MDSEDKALAAGRFSMAFWSIFLLASAVLLFGLGNFQAYLVFAGSGSLVFVALTWYRLTGFWRRVPDLLATGQSLKPYDYSTQARRGLGLIFLVLLAFIVPFLLSGILEPSAWIGSLMGVLDAWLGGLVVYNLYLVRWQRRRGGKLFQAQVWRGMKVTHFGLKFRKGEERS